MNTNAREIVKKVYQDATEYCEGRTWNSGESVAWAWEVKFAELIVDQMCEMLDNTGMGLSEQQLSAIRIVFDDK